MASRYVTALRGYFDRRTPGYLIFFVTPYCNCRCKMCFNAEAIANAKNRRVLRLDEIETFARNFPGLHHVNLSGGEPFLRADFDAIPPLFYEHSGARFFTCATNSSIPESVERMVASICRRCPDAWLRITQSLDGIGPLHDEIRGRSGLFECVMEVNRRLDALCRQLPNLSVGVSMVLSKFNQEHAREIVEYAFDKMAFSDFGVLYVRGETQDPAAHDVKRGTYTEAQQLVARKMSAAGAPHSFSGRLFRAINRTSTQMLEQAVETGAYLTPCLAGRRMVVMDDEGNVEPCEMLRVMLREKKGRLNDASFGNIRDYEYDIRAMLATPHAREILDYIVNTKCHCTFECAMAVNVLYTPRLWGRVAKNLLF